jgi:hypothetical protein
VIAQAIEDHRFGDAAERLHQVQQVQVLEFRVGRRLQRGLQAVVVEPRPLRREPLPPVLRPTLERVGRVAVPLVLEELTHQFAAGVFRLAPLARGVARRGVLSRHEHPRLDLHQRGGHDEELARRVDVDAARPVHLDATHVLEILVRDRSDGDVVQVHLVLADEVQQQVEGTLELVQPHGVWIACRHWSGG